MSVLTCKKAESKKDPNSIGIEVFEILKDFNTKSMDEYISATINLNELKKIAKDTSLLNYDFNRRQIEKLTEEKLNESKIVQYKKIKEAGIDREINWSEIDYLDFTFENEKEEGSKVCNGRTYFKYDDDVFYAESKSIFDGSGYRLMLIEDIRKKY